MWDGSACNRDWRRGALLIGAPYRGQLNPWHWSIGRTHYRSRRCPEPPRRPAWVSTLPVTRFRITMPLACPSTITRSSISVRGNIFTFPPADLAREPGRPRAEVAGRSGRGRKRSAKPEPRRRNDWPASRRILARREHPGRRIGR